MTETTHPVEAAQAPETFDVLSFVEGSAYPTQTVTVYADPKGATDLLAANDERFEIEKAHGDTTEIDARIEKLSAQVKASALTFELRGMPPGLVRDLYAVKDDDGDDAVVEAENKLIAGTIVNVTNAQGSRDTRVWDAEAVGKLRRFLKEGEFGKLVKGVIDTNFNATVFDQATDAGFLG